MLQKFLNNSYLQSGNKKQKKAFICLNELQIFSILHEFNPILAGTIPIEIDINSSDLDILCEVYNFESFSSIVTKNFGDFHEFKKKIRNDAIVYLFKYQSFIIEIFGQSKDVLQQNAYLHMIAEYRILSLANKDFKKKIIALKEKGIKTEPAFGQLLEISDPYYDLLKITHFPDSEIKTLLKDYAKND